MEDDDLSFTQTKKKRRKKPVDIDEIPKDEADGAGDDCKLAIGLDNQNFQRKIVNIFLPIIFSICFGCSKEPSHQDGSFEYPQHMLWLRNKGIIFLLRTVN